MADVAEANGNGDRRSKHSVSLWEADVCHGQELELPRECCKYCGVGKRKGCREPLVVATVEGVDDAGQPFIWVARRARKRVLQPHQCSIPPPRVRWLSALDVRLQGQKLGWWVAALFVLGSLIFLITGIARMTPSINDPSVWPPGLGSLPALLGPWPEAIACVFVYTPAVLLAILEGTNLDYGSRVQAWKQGGRRGPRPRPRILPRGVDLHIISWWAAGHQLPGIMCFNVGSVLDVVSMGTDISAPLATWGIAFTFTLGGAIFTVAGALQCLEETGSWWRGLVPTRWQDLHSLSWMAACLGFWGGVGFTINGAGLFDYSNSWAQSKWLIAFGQIMGSVFFLLSGAAGMLEQANPGHL